MTIKKQKRNQSNSTSDIKPLKISNNDRITFSLKHLALEDKTFRIPEEKKYLKHFLEKLNFISKQTKLTISHHSQSLHYHPIHWDKTSKPNGFHFLDEQLQDCIAYQFSISTGTFGRIHGFFIDTIFFIVWIDPDHKLIERKNT